MVRKVKRLFGSFQSKILVSFFVFSGLLLAWAIVCFFVVKNYKQVQAFTQRLSSIHSQHYKSVGNLQYFMLAGYHQAGFYTTYRQEHIDEVLATETAIIEQLQYLVGDTVAKHIRVDAQLQRLISVHERLLSSVRKLKDIYHKKGFKDYGQEGLMRTYAHFLEDSTNIHPSTILGLRRQEKDYLLRGEKEDVQIFNRLADSQAAALSNGSDIKVALLKYKSSFNLLVNYIDQLGVNSNSGMYAKVQNTVQDLDYMYDGVDDVVSVEVQNLNATFRRILIYGTLLVLALAIVTSFVLSKALTREVRQLNRSVIRFIRSRFTDNVDELDKASYNIAEIETLNRSFLLLVATLKQTVYDLEHAIEEEKRISAELSFTVAQLQENMLETELQKQEVKKSEAKLDALFNSSSSCHLMVDRNLRVMALNDAARNFLSQENADVCCLGDTITDFLSDGEEIRFMEDFRRAIKGTSVYDERYKETAGIWWEYSIVPVKNKEERIIAVAFTATNITQRKLNEQKIKQQNEALLKIAHVQSHHIRGPLATIMGLLNIILLENNFNKGYVIMLKEAVDLLDRRIKEIVGYTEDKEEIATVRLS
ncbi:MAG: PAS domain S-box protein [Sphingobacteriales bacterium]|nr:MAG: PAS domain S-box protein [Sphingobacteriales bacterium]